MKAAKFMEWNFSHDVNGSVNAHTSTKRVINVIEL